MGRVIDDGRVDKIVRIAVEEAFKGIRPDQKVVEVFPMWRLCEFTFESGRRYLVFGSWQSGTVITSLCDGNKKVEDAAEDLVAVRNWKSGNSTTTVFGQIASGADDSSVQWDIRNNSAVPVPGARVTASNGRRSYVTSTGADGMYHFRGIPAGEYDITVSFSGLKSNQDTYETEVAERSCAQVDIGMQTASLVSGVLLSHLGDPVPGIPVRMQGAGDRGSAHTSVTDAGGRFRFERLVPGDYVVSVNPRGLRTETPYAPTFYPGVAEEDKADRIRIRGPETHTGLSFRLPPRQPTRWADVSLKWPDGRPVINASLRYVGSKPSDINSKYVDTSGKIALELLRDQDYVIEVSRLSWRSSSRPVTPLGSRPTRQVKAGSDRVAVEFIVSAENDISAKEEPVNMFRHNKPAPE